MGHQQPRVRNTEYKRQWNKKHRQRMRDTERQRRFGLSPYQYQKMLDEQEDGCAICGRPAPEGEDLHVDHDHLTGEVRGLVCFPCNAAVGQLGDDPSRFLQAVDYLEGKEALGGVS